MNAPLVDVDFETWFSKEIGCDGVIALDIPPHNAPARWTKADSHPCNRNNRSNKCEKCYRAFMQLMNEIIVTHGAIGCSYCHQVFFDMDSFVTCRRL